MTELYEKILESLKESRPVALETVLTGEAGEIGTGLTRHLTDVVPVEDGRGRRFARVTAETEGETLTVREPMLPTERLIVLGGGHIALPLCAFAARCGFDVTVVDDRPAFANAARFPQAKEVLCDSFENALRRIQLTPCDYVVIITRGHVHDADCLRVILPGVQPAYLGLIGSRRRVRGLMEMLREEGCSQENMERICTPIGLNIGAVTPEEIAVSILAEVIAYRRLPEHGGLDRLCCDSDIEPEILRYLAENHEPKAVVTVLEAKGSTPRGAGAKMAVSPLGRVTGSIGGGCSEAAVIKDAVRVIGTGRYRLMNIDLTGEVAGNEGMVCGGTMRVLIEDAMEN